MADKAISELVAAQNVTPTDLFVLEQNGTAKKLTGQILENWLVSFADGHGGIQSIVKKSTSGLVDTYRITLADTTTFDFLVTNGKSINTITKTGTSGLVDTYKISYNDNTTGTFTVTNGAKGDKGDNQYVWIKYASQEPTASSHSFGDVPDNWIGIYSGESATAPTDWQQYEWFQIKGDKGDTGEPATVTSNVVEYQVGDSGTIIPSGAWSASVPVVAQGRYLWSRTTTTFNSGSSAVSYSVSRMGIDGTGSVSSVAGISPNSDGNVPLYAENVGALPSSGGTMTGELKMNGQKLSGLNVPTAADEAATKGYVDNAKPDLTGYATETYVNDAVKEAAPWNLLDNSDFTTPINQRGNTSYSSAGYTIDRWYFTNANGELTVEDDCIKIIATSGNAFLRQLLGKTLSGKFTIAMTAKGNGAVFALLQNDKNSTAISGVQTTTLSDDWQTIIYCYDTSEWEDEFSGLYLRLTNGGTIYLKNIALYEGEYTIGTLPEYRPKGYGTELTECQRYFVRYDASMPESFGGILHGYYTASATKFNVQKQHRLRLAAPTITAHGTAVFRTISGYAIAPGFATEDGGDIGALTVAAANYGFSFAFPTTATNTNNTWGCMVLNSGAYIELSADL